LDVASTPGRCRRRAPAGTNAFELVQQAPYDNLVAFNARAIVMGDCMVEFYGAAAELAPQQQIQLVGFFFRKGKCLCVHGNFLS
jgi:hypothetical protein